MFADVPPCVGTPEGTHVWAMFPGGYGCRFCEAWHFLRRTEHYEEKHPVALLNTHPIASTW